MKAGLPLSYNGKNRTFFFFSYEGLRQRQGLTLPSVTVPTDAQRAAVTDPVIQKPAGPDTQVPYWNSWRVGNCAGQYRSMDWRC